jgi:DNA-binding transcriptional LysR family regulator
MELRQLRYFLAVVDAASVRAAGVELCVAPSALSRAIDQLEKQLGVPLLIRSYAGAHLTPAGEDFATRARAILRAADDAAAAMKEHARGDGLLRVGAICGVLAAGELTLPILRGFRETMPHVALQASSLGFADQLGPLLGGAVDIALVRAPMAHPDLELIPLAREPRVLLVSSRSELAAEASVDVEDVLAEPTVGFAAPTEWFTFWQLDAERGGPNVCRDLPPARDVGQMAAAVASARAVISTAAMMGRLARMTNTRCVALTGASPSVIALVRRRHDDRAAVRRFIDSAVDTAYRNIGLLAGASPV